MNHKYSTWALFGGIALIVLAGVYAGIDGSGTDGFIPRYISPDRIQPSLLFENGSDVLLNGSKICTEDNNLCSGGETINNITNNITTINNITFNITNNITYNITSTVNNSTFQCSGTNKLMNVSIINGNITGVCATDQTGTGGGLSYLDLIKQTSYFKSYDFESVTAGYTTIWIPTAILGGTSALIAGEKNYSGIVSVTTGLGSNSGYAYQVGGITTYLMDSNLAFISTFRPISQYNTTNGTTNIRIGFLDSYTVAMPTDGVYINITQIQNLTGLGSNRWSIQAINRNNNVQNFTTINLTGLNNTLITVYGKINNLNQSEFFIFNSSNGGILWNTNVSNLIPSSAGRETGMGIVTFRTGNFSTQIINNIDFISVGSITSIGR